LVRSLTGAVISSLEPRRHSFNFFPLWSLHGVEDFEQWLMILEPPTPRLGLNPKWLRYAAFAAHNASLTQTAHNTRWTPLKITCSPRLSFSVYSIMWLSKAPGSTLAWPEVITQTNSEIQGNLHTQLLANWCLWHKCSEEQIVLLIHVACKCATVWAV